MTSQLDPAGPLLALLRGERGAADAVQALPPDVVEELAVREGIVPLIAERLAGAGSRGGVEARLALRAKQDALLDILRVRELREVLRTFGAAGVGVLVFKGEQLAHLCYERSDLRPRVDTDLLVRPVDRDRSSRILDHAGYAAVPRLEADLISYQATFLKRTAEGGSHAVDLHWRASNPQEFGDTLNVDELFAGATPVPGLGPTAHGPGLVHTLLLSLVHPIAHHRGRHRWLWDFDCGLLSARMSAPEWTEFVNLAVERRLSALCLLQLRRAVDLFGAPVPLEVMKQLACEEAHSTRSLRSSGRRTQAAEILAGVRALPSWKARGALIRQHLVPSADYMRRVYAPSSRAPLGVLYLGRVIRGAWKYCTR